MSKNSEDSDGTKYWELKNIAEIRMDDALCLYRQERYNGALYLCGYSVEVALKARICKLHKWDSYPPRGRLKNTYKLHGLDDLIGLAGLEKDLEQAPEYLRSSWEMTKRWSPEIRYSPNMKRQPEAGQIFSATLIIFKWIKESW